MDTLIGHRILFISAASAPRACASPASASASSMSRDFSPRLMALRSVALSTASAVHPHPVTGLVTAFLLLDPCLPHSRIIHGPPNVCASLHLCHVASLLFGCTSGVRTSRELIILQPPGQRICDPFKTDRDPSSIFICTDLGIASATCRRDRTTPIMAAANLMQLEEATLACLSFMRRPPGHARRLSDLRTNGRPRLFSCRDRLVPAACHERIRANASPRSQAHLA